ncbi:oxidoreductase [Acetobacterium woodii DSM 1030]|uniref:Oxidoreductase n=2 Tax=Acetobacterium woodii TaxID=33952 RepID=H6LHL2_ACEWD|nr:oxidoreductase [Acetobacterium woodii DSM 1030]
MKPTEILAQENKCIQEEPVYCSAVCPVHVDVRALMNQLQAGKFAEALQLFRSKALFPGIISRICDAPCEAACLRNKLDQAVSVRMLEKACADFGGSGKRKYSVVKKKQRVAIIGGGLTGMSCALELVRKGYITTLYEQETHLGGALWEFDSEVLSEELILSETALLAQAGVQVILKTSIADIKELDDDAIFVATGKNGTMIGVDKQTAFIEPESLATVVAGVFAGGGLLLKNEPYSGINRVAMGKKAAGSIERYLKKASLTSARENEGRQETHLYTKISDRQVVPQVIAKELWYTADEAVAEAKRCLLCECRECIKACTFLDYFNQNPRQYIRDVTKTVTAQKGLRSKMVAARFINSCSLCGQCKEICPNDLDFEEICQEARFLQVEGESMPPAFHDFWLREFDFSISDKAALIRNQAGFEKSQYLFFPGCRMGSSNPLYVSETYGYLSKNLSGGVGLALTCCGAPAQWSGHKQQMKQQMDYFKNNWIAMGKPQLIIACPSCLKMFRRYLPQLEIKSLWELFEELPLPDDCLSPQADQKTVALFDPCASRETPKMQQSIRSLLNKLGYQIEELKFNGRFAQCCTYGGLMATINPTLAQTIRAERTGASPHNYITYCTNCRDDFIANGKATWYLLDIIFGRNDQQTAMRKPPTLSKRRDNRKQLKKELLTCYWGEKMVSEDKNQKKLDIRLTAEVEEKMNREYILFEEVDQVIEYAEKSGDQLFNNRTKLTIAHLQIGIITFWVEYKKVDQTFMVYNAYSHRMQIVEKGNRQGG